jgi:hypothetical protein
MVHTIKIFVLYVGIIAAIQEQAYVIATEMCPGHVYIYPNPLVHTLKSFVSTEYEFGTGSKREGDSKSGSGKSRNASTISRMVPEGSKTLAVI